MQRIEFTMKGTVNDTIFRDLPEELVLSIYVELKERFIELSEGSGSRRTRGRKKGAEEPSPEAPAPTEK